MKLLSLFSGIGAFEKALAKMNINYELVNYCEIDKYASKSYEAVHGVSEELNLGNITKVDTSKFPNDIDLVTYGFPCQDISSAGKQKGFVNEDGTTTRSGLFFEALRIIEDTKPKIAIAENVKNLVSKKFKNEFEIVLTSLENAGYNSYYKVLNAKDYGIPQNRERVFIVSIRKDIDDGTFEFPKPFELKLKLKDMLEDKVDEKYYLSDTMINSITNWKAHQKPFEKVLGQNSICQTLTARGAGENHSGMVIYSDELEETTNVQEKLLIKNNTKLGYLEAEHGDGCYIQNMNTKRETVQKGMIPTLKTSLDIGVVVAAAQRTRDGEQRVEISERDYANAITTVQKDSMVAYSDKSIEKIKNNIREVEGCSATITANPQRATIDNGNLTVEKGTSVATMRAGGGNVPIIRKKQSTLRIRKLTPKECWRLMGFEDIDIDKAIKIGTSNTQLYKQAGNSIVVNVLEHLLEKIIPILKEGKENNEKNMSKYQKSLDNIKQAFRHESYCSWMYYEDIENLQEFVDKEIPLLVKDNRCPKCDLINNRGVFVYNNITYCIHCGQKLKWEE